MRLNTFSATLQVVLLSILATDCSPLTASATFNLPSGSSTSAFSCRPLLRLLLLTFIPFFHISIVNYKIITIVQVCLPTPSGKLDFNFDLNSSARRNNGSSHQCFLTLFSRSNLLSSSDSRNRFYLTEPVPCTVGLRWTFQPRLACVLEQHYRTPKSSLNILSELQQDPFSRVQDPFLAQLNSLRATAAVHDAKLRDSSSPYS